MGEPQIPIDTSSDPIEETLKETHANPSVIRFKHGLSRRAADLFIEGIYEEIIPNYHSKNILLDFKPIFNHNDILMGLDFGKGITKKLERGITKKLESLITRIMQKLQHERQDNQIKSSPKAPISFTELLGTFRVRVVYIIIPIMITILSATFLAWAAEIQAGLDYNVALYPDEASIWEVLLSGMVPVAISAVFIVVIWFLIKKFGMIAFKIVMGIIVFFYSWYGLIFFITVFFQIYEMRVPHEEINFALFNGLYNGLFYSTIILFVILMVFFFSNKLNIKQRNAIVLFYSIFMGSILGISLPTWTTFSFAIFLSVWDLITVFKGPLGKIGQQIKDNQVEMQDRIKRMLDEGQIGIDQVQNYTQFVSLQASQEIEGENWEDGEDAMLDLKSLEIELGSGDLILYSALVANVFVNFGSWFLAIMVIVGVLAGAALTLYLLITKKKMLPALPFSMTFGIILFFVGQLILFLI
ncbi:MAG: hypothetical protein ACTSRK_17475 [Promethearchaeota archaeon]